MKITALILVSLGAVADLVSTEYALRAGGSEGNPLLRRRAARVLLKVGMLALLLWACLSQPWGPMFALAGGVVWCGAATWNVLLMRRLR